MTATTDRNPRHLAPRERSRAARNAFATLPIVLAGSLVVSMTMNLTGPIDLERDTGTDKEKGTTPEQLRENIRKALASSTTADAAVTPEGQLTVAAAPTGYTVVSGDTISGIAARYGLSTASVLALNGLGWKSIIHPGQKLVLTKGATPITPAPAAAAPSTAGNYTIVRGDTISGIASRHGVTIQRVLDANGLGWKSIIYPGQKLVIPGTVATAPASVTPAPTPTPPPAAASGYTIVSGDTLTSIAKRHGVTVQSLLAANNLQLSSIIYAGKKLTIPGTSAGTGLGTVPASSSTVVLLTAEMEGHARTIISVGRSLGVSDYGIVIALSAAAQESTLRNLTWGDRDSVGLFQQRPSTGWGSVTQLTTPSYAAQLFYGGASNPNKGNTSGLLDVSGWQNMTVTKAAQTVQKSGHPDAYAKWETSARAWLAQLG